MEDFVMKLAEQWLTANLPFVMGSQIFVVCTLTGLFLKLLLDEHKSSGTKLLTYLLGGCVLAAAIVVYQGYVQARALCRSSPTLLEHTRDNCNSSLMR
jgi:hypothetical protein